MLAWSVVPGTPGSATIDADFPEPSAGDGEIIVSTLAIGICGTDREILSGAYGSPPPGNTRLVLGHESLGVVTDAPPSSTLKAGDLVVGVVRRPDPEPCANCAAGEWDMCRNGKYTEHGIKALHGFCRTHFRSHSSFLIKLDAALRDVGVLTEPASIVAKAWANIDYIAARSHGAPKKALVLGAGPVGLLAALMAHQRGLEVEIFDRAESGPKPELAHDLGARYHVGKVAEVCADADVILECTGSGELVYEAIRCCHPNGIVCLTGVSSGRRRLAVNFSDLNTDLVLENRVIFGTVNANRRHYEKAVESLARADRSWLRRLITKQVTLKDWNDAVARDENDIKNVIYLE